MIPSDPILTPAALLPPSGPRAAINALSALLGAGVGYFLGGWDGFLYALVVLTILDYLTGTASAVIHKTLSSGAGARGAIKKALMFALVGAAHTLDAHVFTGAAGDGPIRGAVLFFFISGEGISILENAASAGLPIPPRLTSVLARMRDGSNPPEGGAAP